MKRPKLNPNSLVFFYEGYTEEEFYDNIFKLFIPLRNLRIKKINLKGIFNINSKVIGRTNQYLDDHTKETQINIIIACDREGVRSKPPILNLKLLRQYFKKEGRIKSVSSIIATQDLESWFFYDYNGICQFLRIAKKSRNARNFKNTEGLNNRDLAQLFRKHGKLYFKRGRRVQGFIAALDLKLIVDSCKDLKNGIDRINALIDKF